MTSKEATEKKKWEERNAKRIRDWGLNYYSRPSIPEFDYFPSGDLSFQFTETGYNGLRRTFADGKIQRLETMVERICAAAEKIAAARKADRTAREQREREWAEQARLRKEQEKLQGLEKKRIEDLEKSAKAWRHANQLRAYIEEVRSQVDRCEDPDAAMKWVVWAEAYLEKIDPLEKGLPRLLQLDDFSEWELTSRF
jgi:DNA repair exonuclease SbcCD ATPase subunit